MRRHGHRAALRRRHDGRGRHADHHDRRRWRTPPAPAPPAAAAPAAGGRRAGRRPDRRCRAGRPHRGAGRLRPAQHRGHAAVRGAPARPWPRARPRRRPSCPRPTTAPAPTARRCWPPRPTPATKPVRHGGLEVGRQAEAHALAGDAAPGGRRRARAPAGRGRWPSRRCASSPRTSASTSPRSPGPAGGVITRDDVDAAVAADGAAAREPPATPAAFGAESPASAGGEQRIPIKGVRKLTAAAMVASAFTAPHVTEFLTVDVTRMMKLRHRLALRPELAGVRVSPLLLVAKAVLLAVRRHPMVNSTLGRGGAGDRGQGLRQPRHRGGHPARPDRAEHQGRRPAVAAPSWPTRWPS